MICSNFRYIGTDAYWLPALNTNEDIWYTLSNISALGVKVVRLWAFNGKLFISGAGLDGLLGLTRCRHCPCKWHMVPACS